VGAAVGAKGKLLRLAEASLSSKIALMAISSATIALMISESSKTPGVSI